MKVNINKQFVLTISYGDYTRGVGGTDKVILSQQKIFNQNGITNLHIYPILKVRDKTPEIPLWGLLNDGKYQGMFLTEQIVKLIQKLTVNQYELKGIIIHHFQWTDLLEIDKFLRCIDCDIFLYLHDYMTICPYGGMVRDKKFFCGIGKPNPTQCAGCSKFFSDSEKRQKQIEQILQKNRDRLTMIAPSPAAAQIWECHYPEFKEKIKVVYHQSLEGKYVGHMDAIPDQAPLKIAFVGYQADLKGWPQWIEAVLQARKCDCNYEFYQFGTVTDHYDFIQEIKIDFKQSLTAMTDALREYQIDCAVLWSTWPETYSYTYYEAYSGNCFIITNDVSGNIAHQTAARRNGIVSRIEMLSELFVDEKKLRNQVNEFRRRKEYGPERLVDNAEIVKLVGESRTGKVIEMPKSGVNSQMKVLRYNIGEVLGNWNEQLRIAAYRLYHTFDRKL